MVSGVTWRIAERTWPVADRATLTCTTHDRVSIAYITTRVLDVVSRENDRGGRSRLTEREVPPFEKDYDSLNPNAYPTLPDEMQLLWHKLLK